MPPLCRLHSPLYPYRQAPRIAVFVQVMIGPSFLGRQHSPDKARLMQSWRPTERPVHTVYIAPTRPRQRPKLSYLLLTGMVGGSLNSAANKPTPCFRTPSANDTQSPLSCILLSDERPMTCSFDPGKRRDKHGPVDCIRFQTALGTEFRSFSASVGD